MQSLVSVITEVNILAPWQLSILLAVVSVLISKGIQVSVARALKQALKRGPIEQADRTVDTVLLPLYVTPLLVGLFVASSPLQLSEPIMSTYRSVAITVGGIAWLRAFLLMGETVIEPAASNQIDDEIAPIAENIWTAVVIVSLIAIVLRGWGINVTPILASAGILGVAAGFAARDAIANFFGSIALYADKTYQSGQYIRLSNGTEGSVKDISIRSTKLETRGGDEVTVPNAQLNSATIVNHSEPSNVRRLTLPVGISYEADPEATTDVLVGAAEDVDCVLSVPEPQAWFREFGDSALVFEMHVWIDEPRDVLPAKDRVNTSVYQALQQAGIGVPYPQRDVHIQDQLNTSNTDATGEGDASS